MCICGHLFFHTNAHHCVVLLGTRLGIELPGLTKSFTWIFEGSLVNLTITLDDVNRPAGTVAESGDLLSALVLAHFGGVMTEGLNVDDSLVRSHGKTIGESLVVECFAPLVKNGQPTFCQGVD